MGIMDNNWEKNIHILGNPEGGEKEKGTEGIFKTIMAENFSNLGREIDIQIYAVQRIPNGLNLYRATLRHIIISQRTKKEFLE